MLDLAIILYSVNSVLLGALAYIYGKTALRSKASYPLGLFIFALMLLLHSSGTAIGYFAMAPYFGAEAQPLMSFVAALELGGVISLLRVTL